MEETRLERKYCSRLGFVLVEVLVLSLVFQIGMSALVYLLWPQWESSSALIGVLLVGSYVLSLPVAFLMTKPLPRPEIPKQRLRPAAFGGYFVTGMAALYLGSIVGTVANEALYRLLGKTPVDPLQSVVGQMNMGSIILSACILGPIAEEIVFRYLLAGYLSRYGRKTALLTSALLFGLFHGNLSQFFYAFALGLVLGYVFLATGKLRYPIALHMLTNVFGSVLPLSMQNSVWASAAYGGMTLCLTAAGVILFFQQRKSLCLPSAPRLPAKILWGNAGMVLGVLLCVLMFVANLVLD